MRQNSAEGGSGGTNATGNPMGDDGGMADEPVDNGNGATEFDATLSGANVVPPVQTTSMGTAQFFLQSDGATLTYKIDLTNVPNATAVSLHVGAAGDVAGVAHALTPVVKQMNGQVMLTADEQTELTADRLYLDVQTQANPGGEVRGQLTPPSAVVYVANPTGMQEVSPPVQSAYSAHASFVLSADGTGVVYHISTDATPSDITISSANSGLVGQVVYPIGGNLDGTLTITDAAPFQNGLLYLNIVTQAHPTGELRGQIILPGETLFTGVLSSTNEVPPGNSRATGSAQVILDPAHTSVRYNVVVSGTVPTAIELFNAPVTQNAPQPVSQLTLGGPGAAGMLKMDGSTAAQLMTGNVYVNVLTQSNPGGELRAQLTKM
jgi:hypothetical protein